MSPQQNSAKPHQQMQRITVSTSSQNPPTSETIFLTSPTQNTIDWHPSSSHIGEAPHPSASTSVSSPHLGYYPSSCQHQSFQPQSLPYNQVRRLTNRQPQKSVNHSIESTDRINHPNFDSCVSSSSHSLDQRLPVVARSSPSIVTSTTQPDCAHYSNLPYTYHTAAYISANQPYYNQLVPYYFDQPIPSHCPLAHAAFRLVHNNNYYGNSHYSNSGLQPVLHHYPHLLRGQSRILMSQQQEQQPLAVTPGPKLIWLLFMHRHGDRAPLNMAPRDKYNNITYWPEGFGNLNNAGRLRMFRVGKYIRRRYENFLTDNIREVYSRSSDVDRCIESSHAVLAGLYPPTGRFEWNKELLWIPAPVHTVPAPEDYLLNEAGRKYMIDLVNEIHIVQNSEAVKKLYEESVRERALLEKEMGYEYDMFYKFKCTYSTLDIEERNGLVMPSWYTPELKQKLYRFAGIAFGLAGGGTEKLKKIRCAHLLDDMVSRMEMASIDGPKIRASSDFHQPTNAPSDDDRRIVHYSTHDSIMAAFLEALNINTPTPVPPGFGATFFIELYVDLNEQGLPASEKYIKLFYMDDTDSENPVEKKLPSNFLDDKGRLTLNNFKKYIGHLLPDTPSIVI